LVSAGSLYRYSLPPGAKAVIREDSPYVTFSERVYLNECVVEYESASWAVAGVRKFSTVKAVPNPFVIGTDGGPSLVIIEERPR